MEVEDALYMHSGQWADLTADRSEEEAVREARMGERLAAFNLDTLNLGLGFRAFRV